MTSKNIVPPSTIRTEKRNKEYRTSPQMQMNLERSAKVYPHRLITPVGTGNYKEFSPFYGEGK